MKTLAALITTLIIVLGVMLFRTNSVFPDRQLYGAPNIPNIPNIELDRMALAERLSGAIQIPTISHDDRSNFDAAAFLDFHRYLERHYPLVHANSKRLTIADYSLVYVFEGDDPSLKPALFMGHMDVVPIDAATSDQWTHPPFSGAIANEIIWGRGSIDDKLTILALMEAMESLLSAGGRTDRTVYFAFGHDEEVGGNEGAKAVAAHFKQQDLEFEFVLDEGGVVTEGIFPGIEAPVAVIGIAEKGYMNLRLEVAAEGGHSSQPPNNTAAGILAQAIVKVEDNLFDADLASMGPNLHYLGHYFPFTTRFALANTWLLSPLVEQNFLANPATAASVRTTTAVTMLEGSSKSNILPTVASAVVNFRILPGDTVASVTEHIETAIADDRVTVTPEMAREASPVSATDSFGFRLIERTIRGMDTSVLVAPYLVQGGTDAKHFVELSDSVYRFMMIRADRNTAKRIHGVNEQIAISDYVDAVRFYRALVDNLGPF